MLVRARVREHISDLPEWAHCCQEATVKAEFYKSRLLEACEDGVLVVDVSQCCYYPDRRCRYCQREYPPIRAVLIAEGKHSGKFTAFAGLDLDEGPLEAA